MGTHERIRADRLGGRGEFLDEMKTWTDQLPSLRDKGGRRVAAIILRWMLTMSVAFPIVVSSIFLVSSTSAAPQRAAQEFVEMANLGPVRDDDCVGSGGKMLVHEDYDAAIKKFLRDGDELNSGGMVEYEVTYYVSYAVDNTWWVAWLIGIRIYSVGLCAFEAETH